MENKKLSGDFLLIEGYAQWESDEEWEENRCDDELPTAILAIKEWFLQKFAEDSGYGSLDEFFGDYTWETIDSLQAEAEMRRLLLLLIGRRWNHTSSSRR